MPPRPDAERRVQLLDEIESIILKEGFFDLRVGTLASRLHCSRGTLYKLAPSKEELIARVFERYVYRAINNANEQADLLDTAAAKIHHFSEVIDRWQAKGSPKFWREVRDTDYMASVFGEGRARGYRIVQRYLDEGVASGEFRQANTVFVAHVIWMTAAATRDPDLLKRLGVNRKEAVTELMRLIVEGMRPER